MGDDKRGQENNILSPSEIWLQLFNGFKQLTV